MLTIPPADDLLARRTVTVPDAASILGVSRNKAYEAVARGEIPSIRIGGKILVPTARLLRLLGEADD